MQSVKCTPNALSFGRAFSTREKASYRKLIFDAETALGIEDTSAVIFDFNVPSERGKNLAVGSTWSDEMYKFIPFLKSMFNISSVQTGPQGKIQKDNTSPYSGTNFAFGQHIIDLSKLAKPEFASILSEYEIKSADINYTGDKTKREYKTDYNYVLGDDCTQGIFDKLLKKAFSDFCSKRENLDAAAVSLDKEFKDFKIKNNNWLEKEALSEILSTDYGTSDFHAWNFTDQNLYSKNLPDKLRRSRIRELKEKHIEEFEFEEFQQFIAYKQQKSAEEYLKSQNIKLYGDCLLGFSKSEIWSNPDCFKQGVYYGGPDPDCPETNNIQTWGLNALDYTKLGECKNSDDLSCLGETGRLLYDKYSCFFGRYDGLRMDAAWQFVTPFVYREFNGSYEQINLPEINFTIFNIMKAAAKNVLGDKFDENNPDNIMLELTGISADKSREMTLNTYPHLYTTAYAEYDETPAKFKEKGYKDGKFYIGTGCHDNDSLVNLACDKQKRKLHLAGMERDYIFDKSNLEFKTDNYKSLNEEAKIREDFRTAKFAEIFTSSKQFFTLPDAFGMPERINISGKASPENWRIRIPADYERFYFSQLSKGFGLNLPKALANAMTMKGMDNENLIKKCNEAAEVLRSDGPLTEQEADIFEKQDRLQNKFQYCSG